VVHIGVHAGLVVSGEIGFRGNRTRAVVGRAVDDARQLPARARDAGRRYAFTGAALGSDVDVSFADTVPTTASAFLSDNIVANVHPQASPDRPV
jgi:hypothetical protein